MTTFYLGGGYNERMQDDEYQKRLATYAGENLLYIGFANPDLKRRKEKMEELFFNASKYYSKSISYDISSETVSALLDQLSSHNIWVIGGGIARHYIDIFTQITFLRDLLKDKIIFGSSAGAVMWGHYYYETDEEKFERGLGILPYNILVHYDESKKELVSAIESKLTEFPVVKLAEYCSILVTLEDKNDEIKVSQN